MMRLKDKTLNSQSFSEFFKNVPIPTLAWQIVGDDLVLIDHNDAAEKFIFENVRDLLGIKASELFKDDIKIIEDLYKCAKEKMTFSKEFDYLMKTTGEQKAITATYMFLPPDLVIVHAEDITIQKKIKRALQEARDALTGLELIINQSSAVVCLVRNEEGWPVEYITDNIRQFGYEPSDFYSHVLKFTDIIHPDDLENVILEAYFKSQNSINEFVQEYRILSKLGETRWINVRSWIKRERENGVTHFQGIILDITERKLTEEKLKESDEKFRKITEQSLLGVLILQKGKVKYINKALADLAEFESYDIKNWPINEFAKNIYPEDLPIIMENMQEKLEENKDIVSRYVFRMMTKTRKIKWLEVISKTISYQGDLAILATMIDITDKKEAEINLKKSDDNLKKLNETLEQKITERTRELKDSEERYRNMINNLDVGFYKGEVKGKLLMHNLKINKILGIDQSKSLVGAEASQFFENPENQNQYYGELMSKGFVTNFIAKIKKPRGETIVVEINSHLITNNNGGVAQVEGTLLDITEKYNLELLLKESEKKFREIIENIEEGYYEVDLKGNYIYINQYHSRYIGYSKDDMIGSNYREFLLEEEADMIFKEFNEVYTKNLKKGHFEITVIRNDGEERYNEGSIYLKYDLNSKKIGFYGFTRDITERKLTENKLKESEEKYRGFVNNISDIIYELDISGKCLYVSNQLSDISGFTPEEMIGQKVFNYVHPDDLTKVAEEVKRAFKSDVNRYIEFKLRHKDGHYVPISSRFNVITTGEKQKLTGVLVDMTEQKEADKKLRESEEKYRFISENANDLICLVDGKWRFQYCNEAYKRILGYDPKELIGTFGFNYIHQEDAEKAKEQIKKSFHTGIGKTVVRMKRRDGIYRWIESSIRNLYDEDKKFQQSIGVSRDITEQKEAEIKLKESEEKFRSITEQSLMGISILQDDRYKYVNHQFAKITGYSEEEILNWGPGGYKKIIHPKDLEFVKDQAEKKQLGKKNIVNRYEFRGVKKSGETNWLEIFSKSILYQGRTANLISAIDITGRKNIEQKLKESEEDLREAYNRADFYKDVFTHDINNILSNIKASIELSAIYLKDSNRMPDVEKLYEVIRGQFTKGSSLVSNIRKLSQIEESVLLVKPVEINDFLNKEIDFILKSYQTRDVKIRTHGFEEGALVNANDLLIDLFNNLLNNSVKYNESQVVEMDIKMSKEKKDNIDYIKLEFSDNGIGILGKRKDTLFEKEYIKDISSKGLGIGLTLVKKIVDSFKGKIWVEDRIKGDYTQGCNFIVLIPEAI